MKRLNQAFLILLPVLVAASTYASGESEPPHIPNFWNMLFAKETFLGKLVDIVFSLATSLFFALLSIRVYRNRKMIPGKLQNVLETCVEGLYNFIHSIMGENAKKYTPFLGTLFFYILINNLWGIIPGGHSPSTSLNTTLALALLVFLYVQYTGITRLGVVGYLDHMANQPRDTIGWLMAGPMFLLHLFGEFVVKPGSLAFRLCGNITGEDILIAAFVGLGILVSQTIFGVNIGLPFNIPFIFLGLLLSTIQALVFTLLSTIYILMMLPHEEAH